MNALPSRYRNRPAPIARQRGVVLFIALIVMVAMTLAAIALIRSVDTTTQVIGNLAFRQASIVISNLAIEDASASLLATQNLLGVARIADIKVDTARWNYYATHDPAWDDAFGVPDPLQTKAKLAAAKLGQKFTDGANNDVTYVIERMCNPNVPAANRVFQKDPNETTIAWCDVIAPKGGGCHQENEQCVFDVPPQAFYRVTVRVDGPKNTVSFVQSMLRP